MTKEQYYTKSAVEKLKVELKELTDKNPRHLGSDADQE